MSKALKAKRRVLPNGRSAPDRKFVQLFRWMMQSPAWQSLSAGPRALLVELYTLYNGQNNGDLFLSTADAGKRLSVGKSTAHRWFLELEERGFIRARQRGAFNVKSRHATTWILVEHDFAGQPATKDFMRWQPPEKQNTVPPMGLTVPPMGPRPLRDVLKLPPRSHP